MKISSLCHQNKHSDKHCIDNICRSTSLADNKNFAGFTQARQSSIDSSENSGLSKNSHNVIPKPCAMQYTEYNSMLLLRICLMSPIVV